MREVKDVQCRLVGRDSEEHVVWRYADGIYYSMVHAAAQLGNPRAITCRKYADQSALFYVSVKGDDLAEGD